MLQKKLEEKERLITEKNDEKMLMEKKIEEKDSIIFEKDNEIDSMQHFIDNLQ